MDARAPAEEEEGGGGGGGGKGSGGGRRGGGGGGVARVLLLVAAIAALQAVALAGPAHQKHDRDAARVMRVGASSSNNVNNNNNNNDQDTTNNYSVSFVPLFSLIANFLPKLLQRFAIKQPNSRSLGTLHDKKDLLQSKGIFCGPETIGRWKDITDCHQFYECRVNPDSPPGCQTVLSRYNGTQKMKNKHNIKNIRAAENNVHPVIMDQYQNSCITVTTYKCPNRMVFNDTLNQCVSNSKANSC